MERKVTVPGVDVSSSRFWPVQNDAGAAEPDAWIWDKDC